MIPVAEGFEMRMGEYVITTISKLTICRALISRLYTDKYTMPAKINAVNLR